MSAGFSGSSWGLGGLFSDENVRGVLVIGEVIPGKRRPWQGGLDSQCDT